MDKYLLKGTLSENLPEVIRKCGYECLETQYVPFSSNNEYSELEDPPFGRPVVLYGTHGFIKQTRTAHYPGAYCNEDDLRFSVYSGKYPKYFLLNNDYKFFPFSHLNGMKFHALFVRPNDVTKSFGGKVIETPEEVSEIYNSSPVSDNTWVVIAEPKKIKAEYRFFVVNGEVITGSQYRRDGVLDIRTDYTDNAYNLARDVAKFAWQPDTAYTVDIAETEWRTGVIELNSFACAGMYACDKEAIIHAVSEAASMEWTEAYESPSMQSAS